MPTLKLTSTELWLRLITALLLLAAGGLVILKAVVIAGSSSFLEGGMLILPGFALLTASIWLMRTSYEKLHR